MVHNSTALPIVQNGLRCGLFNSSCPLTLCKCAVSASICFCCFATFASCFAIVDWSYDLRLLLLDFAVLFGSRMLNWLVAGCERHSTRIPGRWLGRRNYVIFHADGTWGVQRHDTAPETVDGRRRGVEGDKLILEWQLGGSVVSKSISFSNDRFVTTEADAIVWAYGRVSHSWS